MIVCLPLACLSVCVSLSSFMYGLHPGVVSAGVDGHAGGSIVCIDRSEIIVDSLLAL
jgi:hypothetical protein